MAVTETTTPPAQSTGTNGTPTPPPATAQAATKSAVSSPPTSIFLLLVILLGLALSIITTVTAKDSNFMMGLKRVIVLWACVISVCVAIWCVFMGAPGANINPLVKRA